MTLTIRTAADLAAERNAALRAQITAAIDAAVEGQARSLGYNSAAHCASYVASTVPGWAAEAQAFVAWRDATWLAAFAHAAAVEAGKALADAMGWGAPVFVQPLSPTGEEPPTHWGFPWTDPPPEAAEVLADAEAIDGKWLDVLTAQGLVMVEEAMQ